MGESVFFGFVQLVLCHGTFANCQDFFDATYFFRPFWTGRAHLPRGLRLSLRQAAIFGRLTRQLFVVAVVIHLALGFAAGRRSLINFALSACASALSPSCSSRSSSAGSSSSSSSASSSSSSSPLPACARWPLRASGGSKAHAFSPVYELKGSRLAVFWRAAGLEALATFLETHKTEMSRMTSNIHYRCDGNSQQLQTLKTYGLGDAPQLQEALRLVRVLFGHYQGSSGPRTPPLLDRPAANPAWSCSCPVLPASELDEAWDRLEKACATVKGITEQVKPHTAHMYRPEFM